MMDVLSDSVEKDNDERMEIMMWRTDTQNACWSSRAQGLEHDGVFSFSDIYVFR